MIEMLVELEVSEPIEVGSGVFQTTLTHPSIEGELFFHHGKDRQPMLEVINAGVVHEVKKIFELVKELRNVPEIFGKKKPTVQKTGG
jgi:hypothetical protein